MKNKHKKFYQLVQQGNILGSFLKKKNAERHMKEFNTRVELYPVRIVEKSLMDDMYDEESDRSEEWLNKHDVTSENGGV